MQILKWIKKKHGKKTHENNVRLKWLGSKHDRHNIILEWLSLSIGFLNGILLLSDRFQFRSSMRVRRAVDKISAEKKLAKKKIKNYIVNHKTIQRRISEFNFKKKNERKKNSASAYRSFVLLCNWGYVQCFWCAHFFFSFFFALFRRCDYTA